MVFDTVKELVKQPYTDKKKILKMVVRILYYDGKYDTQRLSTEARQRWEGLRDELIGDDFHSRLKRYAGMNLLEDKFDKRKHYVEGAHPQVKKLAQQAVESNDLLRPELDWLVTTGAENGYSFGYELGKTDKDFSLLPTLLDAQRNAGENASVYFLGGYFRALFEKELERWEDRLDALIKDEKLNIWIPELTWRSGLTDRAGLRVLNLAENGIITINHFGMFRAGGVTRGLSEKVFKKWMKFLLDHSDIDAATIALSLYDFYYRHQQEKPPLPIQLTLRLLRHQALFQKSETNQFDQMVDYHWAEIGKAFVKRYPEKSLKLADKMLKHFGESGTIVGGFQSEPQTVLTEITRQHPEEVWRRVAEYLKPRKYSVRAHRLKQWLQGGNLTGTKEEAALTLIPLEEIWGWVDEDVAERASYLASLAPKTLSAEEWGTCMARDVLVRYGGGEDVRRNLMSNFSTGVWTGPASLRDQELKQKLFSFKEGEGNKNVIRWIDEYVSALDWEIEQYRIEEEREF